jgi:paraquat-inducible protein B
MAEPTGLDQGPEPLPEAEVIPRSRLSIVWLIPLVALIIGGWLAYKTYSERGPTIEIRFNSAAGLQAGKTKVKYKDVDVGEVISIVVSEDLKHVIVRAELVAGAGKYLRKGTRFWVSRPRVTAGRVSGLETLLSGAFIAIDPVTEGPSERTFVGLEDPPVFTTSESGTQYTLRSDSSGSLNTGSPVYYRSIQVGQVVGSELDEDGESVSIKIFVAAPNDRLVLTTTRFWNASGVDFRLGADGIEMDTQSILSVVIGGVAFSNPESLEEAGEPAPEHQRFPLYASRDEAHDAAYLQKRRYLLFFEGSVRGLEVDAPVLLRGIRIGQVLDVRLKFDVERFQFLIPVLIQIEPERIGVIGDAEEIEQEEVMARLVENGLRGQLKSASLITGALYVDLDFHPDAPRSTLGEEAGYQVLPTVPAPLDALTSKANDFLDTLQALPLEEIGNDLRDTVKGAKDIANSEELARSLSELELALRQLRETARSLDEDALPELNAALRQARMTLRATQGVVSPDSALYVELKRTLMELSAAARSIRVMADYLERHPEALIRGKGGR